MHSLVGEGGFGKPLRGRVYSVLYLLRVRRDVKSTVRSPRNAAVGGVG